MITKHFDCSRCYKKTVCKYTESMEEFYKNHLKTYEQLHPLTAILKIDCLEYLQ